MSTTVVSTVRFESAHFLPHVPPDHKCRRMHGHSYRCEIHVTGPVDEHLGWVADFAEIRRAFEPRDMAASNGKVVANIRDY